MDAINKKKKYRQTKLLMKIAREDGMTQIDINRMCRAGSQSVVSDWCRGIKLAPEYKVLPLLEIYGNQIRKQSAKLYYRVQTNVEITQKLIDKFAEFEVFLEGELDGEVIKVDGTGKSAKLLGQRLPDIGLEQLQKKCRESDKHGWEILLFPSFEYVRVEGPIIFQHTFKLETNKRNQSIYRVIVHDLQNGKFSLVAMKRGTEYGSEHLLRSQVEDGIWWIDNIKEFCLEDLIEEIDSLSAYIFENGFKTPFINSNNISLSSKPFKSEALVMPYAFRKSLLNNGYPVDGVLDHLPD
ncbi:hypothetical protein [Terasakiella pusilla]|uniref:hypothetical protein n=1 Tax=Terasakiella pusilla TaxID=64973 RepID=UPI003AA9C5E5